MEKQVKPKEVTPAAEDQQKKGSDSKEEKAKGDAAPAAAAAAAAAAPTPATADTAATAAAPDAAKDVPSDSADAPVGGEGGAVDKTAVKKTASRGGWSFFGSKPKEPSSSLTLSKPETIVVSNFNHRIPLRVHYHDGRASRLEQ